LPSSQPTQGRAMAQAVVSGLWMR